MQMQVLGCAKNWLKLTSSSKRGSLVLCAVLHEHSQLIGTEPLTQLSLVAVFDALDRPTRGGAGRLPEAAAEEVAKRLRGRGDCSSTDENSPSLASWASPF
jgi:hypothetical protein